MPGYYVHLASCNEEARKNRSFLFGVEAPDLLKCYYKSLGIDGTRRKYNLLKTKEMPNFSYFEDRIKQKEVFNKIDGLHYGVSSKPDVMSFWNSLSDEDKKNPFYIGYLWHLLTDLLFYSYIDINSKIEEFKKEHYLEENFEELMKKEIEMLHADWDKTNTKIKVFYPDVCLPIEIEELGVVNFINDDRTKYIHFDTIKLLIDYMRSFDFRVLDIEDVIKDVMSKSMKRELKKR